jgi:hypothetical protein
MCRLIVFICAGVIAVSAISPVAGQEPNRDGVSEFMRAKLTHAQKVLEGLALEDYDLVVKHSQDLTLLSQVASWQVLETAQYLQYSSEFRSATKGLNDAGKKKDLDAATLAYVMMTMKCVNCHKYVRRVQTAQNDMPISSLLSQQLNRQEVKR